jgi:N6-adenosine-specific RNA methylase IME4
MSIEELAALPVPALAHPDGAHFWMWTTSPMIRDGVPHRLLDAWELRWVGELYWNKVAIAGGRWLRSQVEILILAVPKKGPTLPRLVADQGNYFEERRDTKHSRKPEAAYAIIERFSPGPRLELFARAPREGWSRWGNEA